MAFQLLVNILIAIIWQFLQNSFTLSSFITGFLMGIIILVILRRALTFNLYLVKVWAAIKLILIFLTELIKANIDVIKIVLSPKMTHQPGIIALETELKTDVEVTLLASLISLTPGTVSMDFSKDNRTIYIHSLDCKNKKEVLAGIQNNCERAIMEVTE